MKDDSGNEVDKETADAIDAAVKSFTDGKFCLILRAVQNGVWKDADEEDARAALNIAARAIPRWTPHPADLVKYADNNAPYQFGKVGSTNWQLGILEQAVQIELHGRVKDHIRNGQLTDIQEALLASIQQTITLGIPIHDIDAKIYKAHKPKS